MTRLALSLVLAILLLGCSGKAVHVKDVPDQLPPGWLLAKSSDSSIRIGVPSGWRYGVDRMDAGLSEVMNMGEGQPGSEAIQQMTQEMQKQLDENEVAAIEKLESKGVFVNVISEGNKPIIGEARTRFYVQKSPGGTSLEKAADVEREHYAHRPKFDTIQLPIGEAIRTSARDELRDGGVLNQISYVVVDGGNVYSLRFVTEEDPSIINGIAEQVAQTWRIKPGK